MSQKSITSTYRNDSISNHPYNKRPLSNNNHLRMTAYGEIDHPISKVLLVLKRALLHISPL